MWEEENIFWKNKNKDKNSWLEKRFSRERLQKIKISWIYKNFRETFEPVRVAESGRDIDVQEYHVKFNTKIWTFLYKNRQRLIY